MRDQSDWPFAALLAIVGILALLVALIVSAVVG